MILGAVGAVVITSRAEHWDDLRLFVVLCLLAAFAKILSIEVQNGMRVFGDFLPIVIAAVLLGPAPAAVVGLVTVQAYWLRAPFERRAARLYSVLERKSSVLARGIAWLLVPFAKEDSGHSNKHGDKQFDSTPNEPSSEGKPLLIRVLIDLAEYSWRPLIAGLLFSYLVGLWNLDYSDPAFYALFLGVFTLALAINFLYWDIYDAWIERYEFGSSLKLETFLVPVEIVAAILGMGTLYVYNRYGTGSTALMALGMAVILVIYWRAQYAQVTIKRRAFDKLTERVQNVHDLDERTGTHCAAVALYTFEIAAEAGLSIKDRILGYQTGLVHDIGKVDWPMPLLSGEKKGADMTEDDWLIIKLHPLTGADRLADVGLNDLADIVRYHHLNLDGSGYPGYLDVERMPELAKIIRVADTYDVITARDSYQTPRSREEALTELRKCSELCSAEERNENWRNHYDVRYVQALERALEKNPNEMSYRHTDRRAYAEGLDFYRNGLRRKKRPSRDSGTSGASEPAPRPVPAAVSQGSALEHKHGHAA